MKTFLNKVKGYADRLLGSLNVVVDLGTTNTRMGIFEKGIVLREPSYIGYNSKTSEYLFFGSEAKEIYGKAPNFITVSKPIEHSIIADFDATVLLVKHFADKAIQPFFLNKRFIKSKIICFSVVPTSATEVEQKALSEALLKADMSQVRLVEKPIATAAGANVPLFSKSPFFIIDMGGGLIEIAVVVMGGIVSYKSLKNAGNYMDKLIYNYLHLKNGIIIGERTAEKLKIELFSLLDDSNVMTVRGKSLEDGLPKSIRVKTGDIREALINELNHILDSAKELMETVPPEIIDGIVKNGAIITGGLANIKGLEKYVASELRIPVSIPENPQDATVFGLMKLLKDPSLLNRLIIR